MTSAYVILLHSWWFFGKSSITRAETFQKSTANLPSYVLKDLLCSLSQNTVVCHVTQPPTADFPLTRGARTPLDSPARHRLTVVYELIVYCAVFFDLRKKIHLHRVVLI